MKREKVGKCRENQPILQHNSRIEKYNQNQRESPVNSPFLLKV